MMKPEITERTRIRSILFVFLASVCFSTGGLFIKLIPWSALAINGARNLIGAAVIGIFLLLTRRKLVFNKSVLIGAISMIGAVIVVVSIIAYNVWLARRPKEKLS
jgi:drug/metabolite transporter (DMT)-like permease